MAIIAGSIADTSGAEGGALERMLGALPNPVGVATEQLETGAASLLWRGVTGVGGSLGCQAVVAGCPIAVAVDGCITNLASLAQVLGCEGKSEAVILAAAYTRWGVAFVERLEGAFALALYDAKHASLYLVRDVMGAVPLYWGQGPTATVFASLPAVVCAGLRQPLALSPGEVRRELLGLASDCLFQSAKSLEPGTVWSWSGGAVRSRRYRDLSSLPIRGASAAQLITLMREGLAAGVDSYLARPEAALAVAFSGGLDSSTVLGAACRTPEQRERVLAVTAVAGGGAEADRDYAAAVAEHCGVRWDCLSTRATTVSDALLLHAANPVRISDLCVTEAVFSRARALGRNTVLTGAVGDVIGGAGWGWQLGMLRDGEYRAFLRELEAEGRQGWLLPRAVASSAARLLWHGSSSARGVRANDIREFRAKLELLGATGSERLALEQEWREEEHRFAVPARDYASWVVWLAGRYLSRELEAAGFLGRVLGLEVVSPLAHPAVVSVGLSLPWSLRRRGGLTRVCLREAARPWLPEPVLRRREKTNLSGHLLPLWKTVIREVRQGEGVHRTSVFVELNKWTAYCDTADSLPADMVCLLYEVTILERWLGLNAARATGI